MKNNFIRQFIQKFFWGIVGLMIVISLFLGASEKLKWKKTALVETETNQQTSEAKFVWPSFEAKAIKLINYEKKIFSTLMKLFQKKDYSIPLVFNLSSDNRQLFDRSFSLKSFHNKKEIIWTPQQKQEFLEFKQLVAFTYQMSECHMSVRYPSRAKYNIRYGALIDLAEIKSSEDGEAIEIVPWFIESCYQQIKQKNINSYLSEEIVTEMEAILQKILLFLHGNKIAEKFYHMKKDGIFNFIKEKITKIKEKNIFLWYTKYREEEIFFIQRLGTYQNKKIKTTKGYSLTHLKHKLWLVGFAFIENLEDDNYKAGLKTLVKEIETEKKKWYIFALTLGGVLILFFLLNYLYWRFRKVN